MSLDLSFLMYDTTTMHGQLDQSGHAMYTEFTVHSVSVCTRPGKLDFLFHISHLFNLHVGGRSLFIICYCKHNTNLEMYSATAIKSGHVTS